MDKARTTALRAFAATAKPRALQVSMVALSVALASCSVLKNFNDYDIKAGAAKDQYEALEGRHAPPPQQRGDEPPIPNFQSVLAAPTAPELADARRVSIAVTETVPMRDILIELTRKAQVDLEMDPRISGGIIMTATDRPFLEVVDRIAELGELRYKFEKNTLKVELDDPYLEQYRMDVLNIRRAGSSSASSSTDASSVSQAIGGGGGGGGQNKSASSISSETTSDFWNSIGQSIGQILAGVPTRRNISSSTIAATFVPEAQKPAAAPSPGATPPAGGAGGAAAAAPGAAAAALARNQQQAAAAAAGTGAAGGQPSDQGSDLKLAAGRGGGQSSLAGAQYSTNPQAGIITVYANQRQQKAVERYLRDVRTSVSQQVLIEAKVMEITLNDDFRSGIDWNSLIGPNTNKQNFSLSTNFSQNVASSLLTPDLAGTWTGAILSPNGRNNLSIAAQLVSQFGSARTLSSPRLTVLNNQMAQLKVADNQVFFELTVNITSGTATTPPLTTVNSQIKTVPVGLIMSVQPAIDPITHRISLSLRPSITRITGFVNDPGVAVQVAVAQSNNPNAKIPTVTSPIPIIEVREMDSIVNMDSGQTMVMGGLMQESSTNNREGVPGLMDVPILGMAASERTRQNSTSELVIFLKATLVNAPGTISDEDIRLYKTFTPDPRPVAF